jgi:hypothetical protein
VVAATGADGHRGELYGGGVGCRCALAAADLAGVIDAVTAWRWSRPGGRPRTLQRGRIQEALPGLRTGSRGSGFRVGLHQPVMPTFPAPPGASVLIFSPLAAAAALRSSAMARCAGGLMDPAVAAFSLPLTGVSSLPAFQFADRPVDPY